MLNAFCVQPRDTRKGDKGGGEGYKGCLACLGAHKVRLAGLPTCHAAGCEGTKLFVLVSICGAEKSMENTFFLVLFLAL